MTSIEIRDATFRLMPERCVYYEEKGTLLAADLHWGKAEVFQKSGIAVSSKVLEDDLGRLHRALRESRAERLIVLGDLVHARSGVTPDVIARVANWRSQHQELTIELVRGNHDRDLVLPDSWRIEMHDEPVAEGQFLFSHEPSEEATDLHVWMGHLHPMVRLHGRGDSLRLPCFAVAHGFSVLPAFSTFTGGVDLKRSEWKRIFVIAENTVIEV